MQFPTITDCRCYHKEAIVGQGQEHHICSSPICQTNSETLTLCGEGPRKISVSCPLIFASSSTVKNMPGLPYYLPDYLGFFEKHTDALSFPWLAAVSSLVRDQKTAVCRTVTFLWAMTMTALLRLSAVRESWWGLHLSRRRHDLDHDAE